jgi:spermidine synthase
MAQCGDIESAITVRLYEARRWAFALAAEQSNALPKAKRRNAATATLLYSGDIHER